MSEPVFSIDPTLPAGSTSVSSTTDLSNQPGWLQALEGLGILGKILSPYITTPGELAQLKVQETIAETKLLRAQTAAKSSVVTTMVRSIPGWVWGIGGIAVIVVTVSMMRGRG